MLKEGKEMNQIKCPNCGKVFTIDESSYLDIVDQIKNKEFQDEIHEKLELLKMQHEKDTIIDKQKIENNYKLQLSIKENELSKFKQKLKSTDQDKKLEVLEASNKLKEELSEKDKEILQLKSQVELVDKEKTIEKQSAITEKEKNYKHLRIKLN